MSNNRNNKGSQRASGRVEKKSHTVYTPLVRQPAEGMFFKVIWYTICLFLIALFIRQATSKATQQNETKTSFFDGSFQDSYEQMMLKKPFITDLKKIKNEYEWKLFDKVNLEGFYTGKDNYVFIDERTKAAFGDDYFGEKVIHDEVQKAKYVQDKLKEMGIQLLILFAPVKSSIYSEMLPDYVKETKKKITNYETYSKECKEQGLNFIDFVSYFKALKAAQPNYPLFSKFGSHWSYYGECIAVDTTIKRMENLMGTRLPHFHYSGIRLRDTALVRDGDIFRKMFINVPKGNVLAYPDNIDYDQVPNATPQRVLGIGDSYFRCFFYLGAMERAFDNGMQWYYNNSIIPEDPSNPEVWQLDLKAEIMKNKGILLMCNEVNLKTLGDGFIDDAYLLFSDPAKYYEEKKRKDALNTRKKEIRDNKELTSHLEKEAQQMGITLDSLITVEATKRLQKD